jgi:hypothetical protein
MDKISQDIGETFKTKPALPLFPREGYRVANIAKFQTLNNLISLNQRVLAGMKPEYKCIRHCRYTSRFPL